MFGLKPLWFEPCPTKCIFRGRLLVVGTAAARPMGFCRTGAMPASWKPERTHVRTVQPRRACGARLLIACVHGPPQTRAPQATPRRLPALQATEVAVAEEGRAQAQPSRRASPRAPRHAEAASVTGTSVSGKR